MKVTTIKVNKCLDIRRSPTFKLGRSDVEFEIIEGSDLLNMDRQLFHALEKLTPNIQYISIVTKVWRIF